LRSNKSIKQLRLLINCERRRRKKNEYSLLISKNENKMELNVLDIHEQKKTNKEDRDICTKMSKNSRVEKENSFYKACRQAIGFI